VKLHSMCGLELMFYRILIQNFLFLVSRVFNPNVFFTIYTYWDSVNLIFQCVNNKLAMLQLYLIWSHATYKAQWSMIYNYSSSVEQCAVSPVPYISNKAKDKYWIISCMLKLHMDTWNISLFCMNCGILDLLVHNWVNVLYVSYFNPVCTSC
jgi:hypothetical protein